MAMKIDTFIWAGVLCALLAGCATSFKRGEEFAAQGDWGKAVIEYRKAVAEHPTDAEFKGRLHQAELKAADHFYQRGLKLMDEERYDDAIVEYQQGLAVSSKQAKLSQAMQEALARREAAVLYSEAQRLAAAGSVVEARLKFTEALELHPGLDAAKKALAALKPPSPDESPTRLSLSSRQPVTLNFRQTDIRAAFEFIAKSFGLNVVFDEGVKAVPVTLFVKDVTFEQGLHLMLAATRTFYKEIGANSILIIPDSKDKRAQYDELHVRTFYLNNARAKDLAEVLKAVLGLKKITINEPTNSIYLRDTPEALRLVEKIIDNTDRRPPEMVLDVEILEVNRTKSEQLGLDFGQSISVSYDPFEVSGSWRKALSAGIVTLPSTTLRFFKQDVDAKILANPKVRTVHGKAAKIHIGDRVPLRASTIQDATGQVRTTYEYRDIGIKLTAEPTIHLDNAATVKLNLEVSALGQNLGTVLEPAYSIGTRNAETSMVLRDGETALLGGLIQDQERNNHVRLPGLGDIPILGWLFTNTDDSKGRTDVVLTITPRVVRGWELPAQSARQFYSGNDNVMSDRSLSPQWASASGAAGVRTDASVTTATSVAPSAPTAATTGVTAAVAGANATSASASSNPAAVSGDTPPIAQETATIEPSQPAYEATAGQEFEVVITGHHLSNASGVSFEIIYNPQMLSFVSALPGEILSSPTVNGTSVPGAVRVEGSLAGDASAGGNLARVRWRATKAGAVYLVFRGSTVLYADGTRGSVLSRSARVAIR
jgi:general secretion pathway protein D